MASSKSIQASSITSSPKELESKEMKLEILKELSNLEHLKSGGKPPSSFTRSCSHDSSYVVGKPKDELPFVHMDLLSPESSFEVVSIMMNNTSTIEKKMIEMKQNSILLTKALEDKDLQIATLMNKLEVKDSSESSYGPKSSHDFIPTKEDQGKGTEDTPKQERSTLLVSLTNTIRAKYGGSSTISLMYSKPYTKRIDNMRMPNGYQPPKFMQFDGKENPKQHIAHFVETCENAGT